MAARYTTSVLMLAAMPQWVRDKLLDDDDSGSEDAGLMDALIEQAANKVDGYVQQAGYEVPISGDAPAMIQDLTTTVTRYYILRRVDSVSPEDREDYDRALVELRAIASGQIKPGLSPLPTEDSELVAVVYADDRVFTAENLGGPNGI